jgi:hypothetical protein
MDFDRRILLFSLRTAFARLPGGATELAGSLPSLER